MGLKKELENGAQIVLLYTKNFNWKSEKEKQLVNNEPTTGRVYRALKDTKNNCWYVNIDIDPTIKRAYPVEGVRLTNLCYNTTEWDCDMVELTDNNITDYDISTEDYKKISTWTDLDHSDLIAHLEKQNGFDIISAHEDLQSLDPNIEEVRDFDIDSKELHKRVMDALNSSIVPFQADAFKALEYLSMRDPWLLQALSSLLVQIVKNSQQEDSGPVLAISREISMSDELGKGGNIYGAIANIEDYINNDKSIGGDEASLNQAIYHLLLEVSRLKTKE